MYWDNRGRKKNELEREERKTAIHMNQQEKSEVRGGKKEEGWLC